MEANVQPAQVPQDHHAAAMQGYELDQGQPPGPPWEQPPAWEQGAQPGAGFDKLPLPARGHASHAYPGVIVHMSISVPASVSETNQRSLFHFALHPVCVHISLSIALFSKSESVCSANQNQT